MKIQRLTAFVFSTLAALSFSSFATAATFNDVAESHPNYDAIMYLADEEVIQGYPDGTFKPSQTVNRVEAIKMIFAALPVEDPEQIIYGDFPDVDQTAWYAEYFRKAFSLGIVEGYDDGFFRPAQTVNLVENLKILFESAQEELSGNVTQAPYNDALAGQWYTPYIQKAKELNLLDADGQNNVYPAQGMSRAKLAETIYRYVIVSENDLETFDPENIPDPKDNSPAPTGYILTIHITDNAFGPNNLLVPQGSTVRWVNDGDADHNVFADGEVFSSGTLSPGETFTYTFDENGVFTYNCTIHPSMTGKITVKPANEVPTI